MTDELFRVRMRTTPTIGEWRAAIVGAAAALQLELSEPALAVLFAQWALETGHGHACWNWNLGNVRARAGQPYTLLGGAWECGRVVPVGATLIDPPAGAQCPAGQVAYLLPNATQKFAAFDSLDEGASTYLGFLLRPVYARAWEQVMRGDAVGFAHVLKQFGYYTADEGAYAHGLASISRDYFAAIAAMVPADPTPTRPETPESIGAATSLRAGDGVKTFDPDQTAPDGNWSLFSFAEDLIVHLRGSLVCPTCEDTPTMEAA